jgi:hypothetical protein
LEEEALGEDEDDSRPSRSASGSISHAERLERVHQHWQQRRIWDIREHHSWLAHGVLGSGERQQLAGQAELDARVQAALQCHPCCCAAVTAVHDGNSVVEAADCPELPWQPPVPLPVSHRTVTVFGAGIAYDVGVPTVRCDICGATWELSPCEVGCFPSSPLRSETWYEADLLATFTELAFVGTTAGEFCGAVQQRYQQYRLPQRLDVQ